MNPGNRICPACSEALPEGYIGAACPLCDARLAGPPLRLTGKKINWWYFFAVLFAPAIGNLISAVYGSTGGVLFFTFPVNLVCDIGCTFMLVELMQLPGEKRFLTGLLAFIALGFGSLFLSFLGCTYIDVKYMFAPR